MTTLGKNAVSKFEEDGEGGFKTDASTAGSTLLELWVSVSKCSPPGGSALSFHDATRSEVEEGKEA